MPVQILRASTGSIVLLMLISTALAKVAPSDPGLAVHRLASVQDIRFEPNRGQFAAGVDYLARGPRYEVSISRSAAALLLTEPGEKPAQSSVATLEDGHEERQQAASRPQLRQLSVETVGASRSSRPFSEDAFATTSNYLTGSDKARWQRDVPSYALAGYHDVYPGIDIVYYGTDGKLEYDFRVAAGADPAHIRLAMRGADAVDLDATGNLRMRVGSSEVVQHAPVAYQLAANGQRELRQASYLLGRNHTVTLKLGDYDRSRPLVIDPVLSYGTYLGSTGGDIGYAVKTDAAGNIYLIGETTSSGFPVASAYDPIFSSERVPLLSYAYCTDCIDGEPGAQQVSRTAYTRGREVFVTKMNPAGSAIIYSTYIGKNFSGELLASEVKVSPSGEIFFALPQYAGQSSEMPLVNPNANSGAGWAARLNSSGSGFVYAGYYPYDFVRGMAIDAGNRITVGSSPYLGAPFPFPVVNPIPGQACHASSPNMGIVQLSASGAVNFASCLNGTRSDNVRAVAVDAAGDIYVFGRTSSTDFPSVNPLPGAPGGTGTTLALVRLDATTHAVKFSTRFANASSLTFASGLAVDSVGRMIIAGTTNISSITPTANAFQPNRPIPATSYLDSFGECPVFYCATDNYYLASIDTTTPAVVFATYFGGTQSEANMASLAIDAAGYILFAGGTASVDLPTRLPIQASNAGLTDTFLARFSPQGRLNFSTYIGGSGDDAGGNAPIGLATAPDGSVLLAYGTSSTDFPVTSGAIQPLNQGGYDVSLVRIAMTGLADSDNDGVPDAADAFPANPAEWDDHDADGLGGNADLDDDGDGFADTVDRFPYLPSEHLDTDNDGKGDNSDVFPNNAVDQYDFDNDGIGDNADPDADGDGVIYDVLNTYVTTDRFPLNSGENLDTDGDGIGDNADGDRDGDGLVNGADPQPSNSDEPVITFSQYSIWDGNVFKKPLPPAFNAIYTWPLTWTQATDSSAEGDGVGVAMTSPATADGQTSGVQLKTCRTSQVSFDVRVSSAIGDQFRFVVDGNTLLTLEGNQPWGPRSFTLTPGIHDLRWLYVKNASGSAGLDAAWIDNVRLNQPPSCVFNASFD